MLFYNRELKGDMKVYYGNVGFWEHYWIGYTFEGQGYFIDLTMQQFNQKAPELSISLACNERTSGMYSYCSEGEPIKEYADRVKAFEFYVNPVTMVEPEKRHKMSDYGNYNMLDKNNVQLENFLI